MTELLWTGGFDSTFRLCQLAREADVEIQPYYLKLPRPGWEMELKTISLIWNLLQKHPKRRAVIDPVIYVDLEELTVPPEIKAAWIKFRDPPYELGAQYQYIAVFARKHPGIEIGQERYYKKLGHLRKLLLEKGHMKLSHDQVGYFAQNDCDPAIWDLFGNLRLPICELHEPQMAKMIHRWGFEDIMSHVWFCYTPVNGEPCGMCVPCLTKHKNGMYKVLPPEAIARANLYKRLEKDKRNDKLPEGKKLHQILANVFKSLNALGMPCDARSIMREMQKYDNIFLGNIQPSDELLVPREAIEAYKHGHLQQVLDMYHRALDASGLEKLILPTEAYRLKKKIQELQDLILNCEKALHVSPPSEAIA